MHATHDLDLLPRIADRAVVFSEEHRIVLDAPPDRVLGEEDLLVEVSLVHPGTLPSWGRYAARRDPDRSSGPLKGP